MLPRLRVTGDIPLLVDTGADTTTIHWGDRHLLTTRGGEPLSPETALVERARALGIGSAQVEYGREDALLFFDTEEGLRVVARLRVDIELTPPAAEVPSLLGRDVLSEARLDFNMPADDLVLDWVVA